MTGRRPFKELTKDWPAGRRLRVEKRKHALLRDIEEAALADLRKALHVSQEELAHALGKSQAAVAQMESRADMKVSTLREAIEAMGGKLELVAHFPGSNVKIARLGEGSD
jgi:ribosome-binding protein aMBF1 (putative translation factor)